MVEHANRWTGLNDASSNQLIHGSIACMNARASPCLLIHFHHSTCCLSTDAIYMMKKSFQARNSSITNQAFFSQLELGAEDDFDYLE